MKILICNTTDTGGGAATAACRLLYGLVASNTEAQMLVLSKKADDPRILSVSEVSNKNTLIKFVRYLWRKLNYYYSSYRWHQYPAKQNIALDDIFISHLEDCLERIDFDILHLHWVEGGFINFKELQKIKKPIVWTIHGSFPFTGICHHLICDKYKTRCMACPALNSGKKYDFSTENFELKGKRYRNLDLHIVSPSRFLATHAKESLLLGKRPIHVIPNGIDTEVFFPSDKENARKRLKLKNKKTILYGAVDAISDENKGFYLLKESINLLKDQIREDEIQFLIFGGEWYDKFDYETVNLGLIKDEKLMALVYNAADVMVVPSKHENLPYTVMESLACATPVVAFDIGGISEMIDHKLNGYLAKPFEKADLAEGIKWCLENNQNNRLGDQARIKVLNNFKIDEIANRHRLLYESILRNYK